MTDLRYQKHLLPSGRRSRSNRFACTTETLLMVVFAVVCADAARTEVPRRELMDPLGAAWKAGVDRTQRELNFLKQAAAAATDTRSQRGERKQPAIPSHQDFSQIVLRRVLLAEDAVRHNAEFMSSILDRDPDVVDLWSDDADDCLDDGQPLLGPVVRETEWGVCSDDVGSTYYATAEEVLGHLCRDFGYNSSATRSLYATVRTAVGSALARFEAGRSPSDRAPMQVLVPGTGAAGLLQDLAASLPSVFVTGTECSKELSAVASYMLRKRNAGDSSEVSSVIYPWALTFGNIVVGDTVDQFAPCELQQPQPFLKNAEIVLNDIFSGQSETRLGQKGPLTSVPYADVVVTVYTVDAVSMRHFSVLKTLDRIAEMLSSGGCWINAGPLVYHSTDAAPKLSAAEMVAYMADVHGFVDELQPLVELPPMPYARPQHTSMAASHHAAVFFGICRAP